jgi:hypothetical protein
MVKRVCENCGVAYKTKPSQKLRFCSMACYAQKMRGSGNPKWRGGAYFCGGYRYVYSPEHPLATKAGYVLEHRLAVEAVLGRYLLPTEVVHHKNKNTLDNRKENLSLCNSTGKHAAEHHVERNAAGKFGHASSLAPSRSKLDEGQRAGVKLLREQGLSYKRIAEQYGVSLSCIAFLCQGRTWRT